MKKGIKELEEIKAHICIAKDNLIEAAILMQNHGELLCQDENSRCIGRLVILISLIDSQISDLKNKKWDEI